MFGGSRRPIPPCFLGRYKACLAIDYFVVNSQMFLNIFDSIWVSMLVEIGNILLRKVTLERIIEFSKIAFPLKEVSSK